MVVHLLVTKDMEPVPENIKVLNLVKPNELVLSEDGEVLASGSSQILSGMPEAFKEWLQAFDGVWVGSGVSEEYKVMHIK